jgi:hypothetical protein
LSFFANLDSLFIKYYNKKTWRTQQLQPKRKAEVDLEEDLAVVKAANVVDVEVVVVVEVCFI